MRPSPHLLVIALVLGAPAPSNALERPVAQDDARVGIVTYHAGDVVEVVARPGEATQIVLGENEAIEDAALGDASMWTVNAARGDHYIYLRPKQDARTSNLLVTTNHHVYSFELVRAGERPVGGESPAMYRISFKYPDDPQPAAMLRAKRVEALLKESPVARNSNYSMQVQKGSDAIAPIRAYDDARFTYLEFAAGHDMPAAFAVTAEGSEALVASHVEDGLLVLHRVSARWSLRLGNLVVGLWNETPDAPAATGLVTVTGVTREVREAK